MQHRPSLGHLKIVWKIYHDYEEFSQNFTNLIGHRGNTGIISG